MNDFDNKQICSYKDIDRFGFTCDVCGRKVNGCHYINGMKFCAKCYQETFGKDNQQNEIQQIKQQLEEKDKEIEKLKTLVRKLNHEAQKYYEDAYCNSFQNQKAIAELEKVKKTLSAYVRADHIIWDFNVNEVIDQQIKELKGEKGEDE